MASYSKRYKKDPETGEDMIDPKTGKKIVLGWRLVEVINGKPKEFTGKTKGEAERKRDKYKEELREHGNVISKRVFTVSEWTFEHLFVNKHKKVADSTFQGYKSILDNQIKPSKLGDMNIQDVSKMDIQKFLNDKDDLAYSTLKKYYLLLLQSFESARENNVIRNNPVQGVEIPNKDKEPEDVRALTKQEQKAYIEALDGEPQKVLYLTLMFTGLRLGEALSLKWDSIDLKHGEIYVKTSIRTVKVFDPDSKEGRNERLITKPKRGSIRTVPIPEFLNTMLSNHKPFKAKETDYVFKTKHGNPHTARNIRKYHDRICKRANLKPFGLHVLRHTFASRLIELNESPKKIQVLLGHKDIQTTLNIYSHILEETKKMSAEKQNNLFEELTK